MGELGGRGNTDDLIHSCVLTYMAKCCSQREADAAIELLRTKNGELESVLDVLKSQPEQLNIDEAVTGTNKLYNQ